MVVLLIQSDLPDKKKHVLFIGSFETPHSSENCFLVMGAGKMNNA